MAKGKRIRAQRAAAKPPPVGAHGGMSTWTWVAVALGIAGVLAVILIVASRYGADSKPAPETTASGQLAFADEAEQMLQGIPQDGTAIGEPDADVTLVEFADLQCPFCAQWALEALPAYLADYVRKGQLRIDFRPITIIGADSQRGALVALAAGEQDKLWNAVDLMYQNQGSENSGWVSDDFVAALGRSIAGLDGDKMIADSAGSEVADQLAASIAEAQQNGVDSTPTFLLGPTGGKLEHVTPSSLGPEGLRDQIEALL
jgi:protein-disulfide isomerase